MLRSDRPAPTAPSGAHHAWQQHQTTQGHASTWAQRLCWHRPTSHAATSKTCSSIGFNYRNYTALAWHAAPARLTAVGAHWVCCGVSDASGWWCRCGLRRYAYSLASVSIFFGFILSLMQVRGGGHARWDCRWSLLQRGLRRQRRPAHTYALRIISAGRLGHQQLASLVCCG